MLKNLLKISYRNLIREKGYTAINILGLTTGITCCLFLLLYILDELTYDRYHTNADNIYRVVMHVQEQEDEYTRPLVQIPLAVELAENHSVVKNAVRFFSSGRELFKQEDNLFYEEGFYYTDSSVFDMFTCTFIAGHSATALDAPHSIVLSESMAIKYFGTADALGRNMTFVDRNEQYKVTGVIKDVPYNSHFRFDALMSVSSLPMFKQQTNWGRILVSTYIQLPDHYRPNDFQPNLTRVVTEHVAPIFEKKGIKVDYQLQRITDIHLHSKIQDEEEAGGDIAFVYILSAIAVFVLVIACINYMNLATARSARRAKEVGIRKVMGSFKTQLMMQFIIEALALAIISLMLSLALVYLLIPVFNLLADKKIAFASLFDHRIVTALAGIVFFLGFAGGGYPAFYLSQVNAASVLKGRIPNRRGHVLIRKALVVVQFSISIFMLISTVVVYDQLHFLRQKDLGFNKDHIIRIPVDDPDMRLSLKVFKDRLISDPAIQYFATATATPGENVRKAIVQVEDDEGKMNERSIDWYAADYDFADALGMTILKGRNFSTEILSDTLLAVLVNEAMVKKMNWTEPLGKRFQAEGRAPRQVIGVIKDYHQNSLYDTIEPLVVLFSKNNYYTYIKLNGHELTATVARVKKAWYEVYPDKPFEFQFLDQAFNAQYDVDERRSTIFTIFSALTIVIACLGLLGLTAFSTEQRAKEIGIRKVVGASIPSIVMLISKEFIVLVVLATLIAFPAVYYFMDHWLQDFAYRIDLKDEAPTFILSAGIALLITMATVAYHAAKAALANPVHALKAE